MKGRFFALAAVILALVVAGAAYVVLYAPDATPGVDGLAASGVVPTDSSGLIAPGPSKAAYSPNGAHLAVLSDRALSLAVKGDLTTIVEQGSAASRVVDFAWMPTSDRLLVAEGPAAIQRLNVVDLKGEVVAAATLSEPLVVEDGNGMTVDSTNTRAVLTVVSRDPIGGRRHYDLAVVDLTSGKVEINTTPAVEETHPFFVADGSVLATVESEGEIRPAVIDLASGTSSYLGPKGRRAVAAGVLRDSGLPVIQTLATKPLVRVVDGSRTSTLGELDSGGFLVALHPTGAAGVERVVLESGESRLRVVAFRSRGR